jgi:hypothetical protein
VCFPFIPSTSYLFSFQLVIYRDGGHWGNTYFNNTSMSLWFELFLVMIRREEN